MEETNDTEEVESKPPQKRRRRKLSQQGASSAPPPRRRRRRASNNANLPEGGDSTQQELPPNNTNQFTGLASNLLGIEEDVEEVSTMGENPTQKNPPVRGGVAKSGVDNHIYIEIAAGFRKERKEDYATRQALENLTRMQAINSSQLPLIVDNRSLEFAIHFNRGFFYISTCVLGFLSGFALLHTLAVWRLDVSDFLSLYSPHSRAMTIVFYILIAILCVAVSDRVDYAEGNRRFLQQCCKCQFAGFVVLVYYIAMIINCVMAPYEFRWTVYSSNTTYWSTDSQFSRQLNTWRILDSVRCGLLLLGWLVVAFDTQLDRISDNLRRDLDDILGPEKNPAPGMVWPNSEA